MQQQKSGWKDSDEEIAIRMVSWRNQALKHLLAQGASTGLAVKHVCVCVCVCAWMFVQASVHLHRLSGLAQWVGSVGWRGAPWISLQASSLSGPAKVSLLPAGVRSGGGEGDASAWPPGTLCLLATAELCTRTLREWTLTPIWRHTIKAR